MAEIGQRFSCTSRPAYRGYQAVRLHTRTTRHEELLGDASDRWSAASKARKDHALPVAPPHADGLADLLRSSRPTSQKPIQTLSISPELTWARDWFLQLGHDETNPATLVAFTQMFADGTRGLRKLLNEAIPR